MFPPPTQKKVGLGRETPLEMSRPALAKLDDALSAPLFWGCLPHPVVEWLYAYPACFFGIPGVIGGPLLALAGSCIGGQPGLWKAWSCLLVVIYVVSFRISLGNVATAQQQLRDAKGRRDDAGEIHRLEKYVDAHVKGAMATFSFYKAIPCITFAIAYRIFPKCIGSIQYFAFATLGTQIIILVVKRRAARRRPCARTDFPRVLPTRFAPLSSFISTGKYMDESFPSGDAAEAVVFAATLLRAGWTFHLPLFLVFLSATGRVYFHAHHVLDVTFGSIVAAVSCYFISNWLTEELDWYIPLVCVGLFIGLERGIRKFTSHLHSQIPKKGA